MKMQRRLREDPLERARLALSWIGEPIGLDDLGRSVGSEDVEHGLDAMASALSDLRGLELGAASLDEVLAEMGVDDARVEDAAELIELLGRSSYAGGLAREEALRAERLRAQLFDALEQLLGSMEQERRDA